MADLYDELRADLRAAIRAADILERARELRPIDWYPPHQGQIDFHKAPHIIRALWPGNGFGKTRAMGSEFAWWTMHCHPYQKTPRWPVLMIWAAETYKQFEILRDQLQVECLGPERSAQHPSGWKFNKNDKCYVWPHGDKMFLISGDASWTAIQGINPDLVGFDEEPPKKLWNEMKMRRRGRRKTRFIFAATATQGMTWMYHELYKPWLEYHAELSLNEDEAIEQQVHPRIWALPRGGIADNPGADAGDRDWYQSQTFASDAEKAVRLYGGFQDFTGKPVFDLAALERMRPGLKDGEDGWLVQRDPSKVNPKLRGRVFDWMPGMDDPDARGRVTIFEHPDIAKHKYVIGHDSAYGLETGDFDYCVVLDRNTGRQVAEAQGHWGDARWAEVLHALHWYYGTPAKAGAFMVGERQVGLMVMRRLHDEMGVSYQYFDRDESKKGRRKSDILGHHRHSGDLVIPRLRRALGPKGLGGKPLPPEVTIVSRELFRQCTKFQWRPRNATIEIDSAHDSEVIAAAPAGDHDDGVFGLGYSRMALLEVEQFEEPEAEYAEGTYGQVFNIAKEVYGKDKKKGRTTEREVFEQEGDSE